jgi:hypothetical protein
MDSSTARACEIVRVRSALMRSPGRRLTTSPRTCWPASITLNWPSRRTRALVGSSERSRSAERSARRCARAYRLQGHRSRLMWSAAAVTGSSAGGDDSGSATLCNLSMADVTGISDSFSGGSQVPHLCAAHRPALGYEVPDWGRSIPQSRHGRLFGPLARWPLPLGPLKGPKQAWD